MQISAGKIYRTAGGETRGPMRSTEDPRMPWTDGIDLWMADGRFSPIEDSYLDLIAEDDGAAPPVAPAVAALRHLRNCATVVQRHAPDGTPEFAAALADLRVALAKVDVVLGGRPAAQEHQRQEQATR